MNHSAGHEIFKRRSFHSTFEINDVGLYLRGGARRIRVCDRATVLSIPLVKQVRQILQD